MKSFDIKPLVNFAIAVITISIAIAQYGIQLGNVIKDFAKSLNSNRTMKLNGLRSILGYRPSIENKLEFYEVLQ